MELGRAATLIAALALWGCAEGEGSYFDLHAGGSANPSGPVADAGGSTPSGGSGGSAGDAGGGTPAVTEIGRPNPIVSRSAAVFASPPANSVAINDGTYHGGSWSAGSPTAAAPAWIALQLSAGPTRVLVSWDDGGTYDYERPNSAVYGLPAAYRIEVSADSTNGADGTWAVRADVTANTVRTRAHSMEFAGQSWIKLIITGTPPMAPNGVAISEIDVHDISASGSSIPDDTWFFMGDSITAFAYDRAFTHQPSFAAGINAAVPAYFPAMINGGIGGETSPQGLARLTKALELNPDYRFFVLGFGTNDAAGSQVPVATFKSTLQTMIDQLRAAGREPVIPHIPAAPDGGHAAIPLYNTAIDELTVENSLIPGPDLFGYFTDTPGLFTCPPCSGGRMTDNLHPNDDGLKGMNAAWTEAMLHLYE